jgi:ATP-binding cassette, subfamily B, bacterial
MHQRQPRLTSRQIVSLLHDSYSRYYKSLAVLIVLTALGALAEALVLIGLVDVLATIAANKDVALQTHLLGFAIVLTVWDVLFLCIGIALLRAVVQALAAWLGARLFAHCLTHERELLFVRFMDASWDVQSQEQSGQLQDLLTQNAVQSMRALSSIYSGMVYGITFLILMGTALLASPVAVVASIAVAGCLFLTMRPLSNKGQDAGAAQTVINKGYAHDVTQIAGMSREIRTFDVGRHYKAKVAGSLGATRRNFSKIHLFGTLIPTLYQNLSLLLVLGGTGIIYAYYAGDPARIGIAVLLLVRALTYSQGFQSVYHGIKESVPHVAELRDMAKRYGAARRDDGGATLDRIDSLAFGKVSFSYTPGTVTLKEIDFKVQVGEIIGVVGPSGAGKSTLIQLLLRLRIPTVGSFTVNGEPVQRYSMSSWYNLVSYVPQEAALLDESIYDNIAFHRPEIDRERVEEAARMAHIHDEILSWAEGYATVAGDRGGNLSGGQRQRICIARALANRPSVIIFDEPTSALDMYSESRIQQTLEGLRGKVTVFIIAHRLSTLSICDRIMVLNQGELQGFGPPDALSKTDPYYTEALRLSGLR